MMKIELTNEEKDYILNLLNMSKESLDDLKTWEEQDVMSEEDIEVEEDLINSITDKLNPAVMSLNRLLELEDCDDLDTIIESVYDILKAFNLDEDYSVLLDPSKESWSKCKLIRRNK